jgi:hypothetical protein
MKMPKRLMAGAAVLMLSANGERLDPRAPSRLPVYRGYEWRRMGACQPPAPAPRGKILGNDLDLTW